MATRAFRSPRINNGWSCLPRGRSSTGFPPSVLTNHERGEDMSGIRKALALTTTACLVIASNSLGQGPEAKKISAHRELSAVLAKSHEIRVRIGKLEDQSQRDAAEQEFKALVSKYWKSFSEVPANFADKARYTKMTM